jgi:site-specific recombinase XerD
MNEQVFCSARVIRRLRASNLGASFDDLIAYLVERGHPVSTIQQYVQSVEHFDGWLRRTRRSAADVDEALVDRFIERHLPRCRCPPPCSTSIRPIRSSLHHLLIVLRNTGVLVETNRLTAAEQLIRDFQEHLLTARGAAVATCASSVRVAREFLAHSFDDRRLDLKRIKPAHIAIFLAQRSSRWSPASMQVAASCLRRFFRYLQMTGQIDVGLDQAVPKIAQWRLASIPRILTDAQVDALLESFDRSTPVGLRGYATTMCLARLGLRACEVSALTLDDIDWRAGTLTIPATKTRRADVLPLSASVARAIANYLRHGRPQVTTRQIFVRHATPFGATGPGIVRAAVRVAGARIGLDSTLAGPNALRHTVATRLLRSGATMKEVADVLRHRSIDTSAIYAKVDLESLRQVAAPWPGVEQ